MTKKQVVTPAYELFRELGQLAQAVFSDVVDLHQRGQLGVGSPYSIPNEDAVAIGDPKRYACIQKIAASARFPWQIMDIRPALRRAEVWLSQDPNERRLARGHADYAHTTRLNQAVLHLARRMVISEPTYGELAFGLTEQEVTALKDASDVLMLEASAHVRLTFRSAQYRDILRTYATIQDARAKDTHGLLGNIARMSGLGAPRIA